GAEVVAEALDKARMIGVRAAAVRDAVAIDAAALKIDEVEARLARGLGEIDDADRIAGVDAMRIECRPGAREQLRVDTDRSARRGRHDGRRRLHWKRCQRIQSLRTGNQLQYARTCGS